MWDLLNQGDLKVTIPALCLTEAVKTLEAKSRSWRRIAGDLSAVAADIQRSTLLSGARDRLRAAEEALASLEGPAEAGLWQALKQIDAFVQTRRVRLIPTTAEIVIRAADIRDQLKLSPADALVMATVVESRIHRGSRHFLSRDTQAYDSPPVCRYMEEFAIVYHPHSGSFLRTIRQG
jgi:predicted nucleic acid-binding protein